MFAVIVLYANYVVVLVRLLNLISLILRGMSKVILTRKVFFHETTCKHSTIGLSEMRTSISG